MYQLRAGSKHLIREINQASVLNTIRARGPISRTEIAAVTDLSLPTISGITAELIYDGLIYERAAGTSTGGRRPILLAFNGDAGYVVGIKLTEHAVIAALTNLEATIVTQHQAPLRSQAALEVIEVIAAVVEVLSRRAAGKPLFGVGLGMGGAIDAQRGLVRYATYLGWRDLPLQRLLEQQLDLPVVIDNDVNALTAAEQWFGAGRGVDTFIVISLGRGIGMGMVLDGQLYRGTSGGAGEFGHITVDPRGPRCACGKRGCLEALISEPVLLQRIAEQVGTIVDAATAVGLAQQDTSTVRAIFTDAGQTLGIALANVVNIFNPALVIVGGEGTRAGRLLLDPLEAALREHCFFSLCDDLQLIMEPWGDEAWARGAASLLLNDLFRPSLRRGDEERPSLKTRTP